MLSVRLDTYKVKVKKVRTEAESESEDLTVKHKIVADLEREMQIIIVSPEDQIEKKWTNIK